VAAFFVVTNNPQILNALSALLNSVGLWCNSISFLVIIIALCIYCLVKFNELTSCTYCTMFQMLSHVFFVLSLLVSSVNCLIHSAKADKKTLFSRVTSGMKKNDHVL